jgi:ribosomal protein S27AE
MEEINLEDVYDEGYLRILNNFCPGCGADNMPKTSDYLPGNNIKPLNICPKCGFNRTPSDADAEFMEDN